MRRAAILVDFRRQENADPEAHYSEGTGMGKRFAANRVISFCGETLSRSVVELDDCGKFRHSYPLTEEIQNVEWMLGAIELVDEEAEGVVAYHLYPYDVVAMSCVDGTRRTRLQ
jgi:hypothetical protein